MCGRFALYSDPRVLRERFGLVEIAAYRPSYNIAPGQPIAGITRQAEGRRLDLYRWWLVPAWAAEIGRYSTINARAETVASKPAFRGPFRHRRCLIPADGYYEWQRKDGVKQPWFIHAADGQTMAFAGLYDIWQDGLRSAAIIVKAAGPRMQAIHPRMPAILEPGVWAAWLSPETAVPRLLEILDAAGDEGLEAWPVSTRVNAPVHDGPELIAPLTR